MRTDVAVPGALTTGSSAGRPPTAADVAARWIVRGRRVEMQGIADELGVSRVTLFRNLGTRDRLLGAALWVLTEQTLRLAEHRWASERNADELDSIGIGRHLNALVSRSAALHTLLEAEPALTIKVLTDPLGQVQPGVVAFVEHVLRRDIDEHGYVPIAEPGDLAFALVRLGESFLYADVLAARTPDVDTANRIQRALIEGGRPIPIERRVGELPGRASALLRPERTPPP